MRKEILEQIVAAHEAIGWRERSEVGKIVVRGEDRYSWLQGMISNDTRKLALSNPEDSFQACLLDSTGHVISDLKLTRVAKSPAGDALATKLGIALEEFVIIELPHENLAKTLSILDRYLIMEDVELIDATEKLGCVSLLGAKVALAWDFASAQNRGSELSEVAIGSSMRLGDIAGVDLYFHESDREIVRERIEEIGMTEIEAETFELLRIEAGIPRYGFEIDERVIALEAGLAATHISLTKGCYVGQEIIARIDSRGHTNRALTGFTLHAETLPPLGTKLYAQTEEGWKETGKITSIAAESPEMNFATIALGYARHEHRNPGERLRIGEEDTEMRAEVVEIPFRRAIKS